MITLSVAAGGVANMSFMCIGIWMAHSLYRSNKALWKIITAWGLSFIAAGVLAAVISTAIATPEFTHERISMFCGFCCVFVYIYLFPSVPMDQRVFSYFFVDNCMYVLVILARYLSVFLLAFLPKVPSDLLFLGLYFLLAAGFILLFAKKMRDPMLRGLAVFRRQLRPLAIFAFFSYVTTIMLLDPWRGMAGISVKELIGALMLCILTGCAYYVAFRTMELINANTAKELETKGLKEQLVLSERYYENLVGSMEKTKAVRHDLSHHLRIMGAMCQDGKWEALQEYLDALQKDSVPERIPIYCEDYVANVLLDYYERQAVQKKIDFQCQVSLPAHVLKDSLKLGVILGNGLQNALEACERMKCGDPYISVKIKIVEKNLLLKIVNSFDGTVKLEEGRLRTVKEEENHGIGLANIKSMAELYQGHVYTEFTEHQFTLSVVLDLERQQDKALKFA